jgi:hypothetical protein
MFEADDPEDLARLRRQLMPGYAPRKSVAEALGKSERTIVRLRLPTAYVGRQPWISVRSARAKLTAATRRKERTVA